MKCNIKFTITAFICLSAVLLSSCVLSDEYLRKKAEGIYPDTPDFPYTKWTCREIDLSINMFGYGEHTMIGTYQVDGTSYHVVSHFGFDTFDFYFYPVGEECVTYCGAIFTEYYYDKAESVLVCSPTEMSEPAKNETIPKTLTFEKVDTIANTATTRWVAEGVDGLEMYLDSFSDVDGYFRGEMVIDGEKRIIQAMNTKNNEYELTVEDSGVSGSLIDMYFVISDGNILATVNGAAYDATPGAYPDWKYGKISITFKPQSY